MVKNIIFDGAAATGLAGLSFTGANSSVTNFIIKGFAGVGLTLGAAGTSALKGEITTSAASCTEAINATSNGVAEWVWIHDIPCSGLVSTSTVMAYHNLITNITGASSDCASFSVANSNMTFEYNTVSSCGRDGLRVSAASASSMVIRNNIFASATGTALNFSAGAGLPNTSYWKGNVFYNNGTNRGNIDDEGA